MHLESAPASKGDAASPPGLPNVRRFLFRRLALLTSSKPPTPSVFSLYAFSHVVAFAKANWGKSTGMGEVYNKEKHEAVTVLDFSSKNISSSKSIIS
ncbi:hypothetical protein KSP40_PGU019585 [Platanthera guangdongensis]|uniref:Uncharacterized protein n=1 Tax=Platanthera guangdongensis TaxID=2320717 RepID=A0ABR2MJD3_9ASPA